MNCETPDCTTLRSAEFLRPGEAFHFSRVVLARTPQPHRHDHDYYEIFWLHHGAARHRINGELRTLREGDIAFIRPTDCHCLQGKGEETHLVNIAFPADFIAGLAQQFPQPGRFFWSAEALPEVVHRDHYQLANLSHRALALEAGGRTKLAASAFLLGLFGELQSVVFPNHAPIPDDAPAWLHEACRAARDPAVFRRGAAGLAQVSGHAHAHVSRTMQKHLHQTPSGFINAIRMEHAARLLTGTSDNLPEIARDCGIANLAHFHRVFRLHFAMTPAQFRRRYQKDVVQPI
jgi:AraC family transcriptional regulator, dual regulator of chb operon